LPEINGVLLERLKRLREYRKELDFLEVEDLESYLNDLRTRRAVERTLQITIEACLDIGQRLIAEAGFRTPNSNRDVMTVLNKEGVIPDKLLPNLVSMVGFRNVIVHNYADLNDEIVFQMKTNRLEDIDAFAAAILDYLEKREKDS
jgi:uncharacterized protein YutE (UPF0331/DUF86 family)